MYIGPWVAVEKPPSSHSLIARGVKPRTVIHDDDAARARGFKAGIVGGATLMTVTAAAIPASLGEGWFEGGVYSVRHRNVTYEGEVRAVWENVPPDSGDRRKIVFHLENRDGNTSTYGWAATVKRGDTIVAPWERSPSPRGSVGDDASPDVIVGASLAPFELVVRPEDVLERDQHWWYRVASPFGRPLMSPLDILMVYYHGRRMHHGRRIDPAFDESGGGAPVRASMDAGTDIVVHAPVFLDRTYLVGAKVADKWQTAKTAFTSTEYSFTDKETGRLVAVSRNYSAVMLRTPEPAEETVSIPG